MDRKTILAVVLSLGIYYAWLAMRPPQPKPGEPGPDGTPIAEAPASVAPAAPVAPAASSAALPAPPPDTVTMPFHACGTTGSVSTDGGRLHGLGVDDSQGPYQVQPLWRHVFDAFTGKESLLTWLPYGPDPGHEILLSDRAGGLVTGAGPVDRGVSMRKVGSSAPGHLELVGTTADQIEVHKTFDEHLLTGSCQVDVKVSWTNLGTEPFTGETWTSIRDHVVHPSGAYDVKSEPLALVGGKLWYGGVKGAGCAVDPISRKSQITDDRTVFQAEGPASWFGMSDGYFGIYAVPVDPAEAATLRLQRIGTGDDSIDGAVYATAQPLAPGSVRTQAFAVYVGANQAAALTAVDPSLGSAIDLGFWTAIGKPLLFLLRLFEGWVGNWGVAIILLTVVVKMVTFPLTQRAFKATQKMQLIQPELARIKEQYAEDPAEMQRRTMALMSENGANPLSGCGPMLLQTPIWIALAQVIRTSADLYHTSFLYLKDLASPDPYMVLPLAITGLMWGQQQLSQVNTANLDPAQQQTMKYMPLIMGLLFFAFPSGLAVYVFVNTLLSILQQWLIRRSSGAGAAPVAVATS